MGSFSLNVLLSYGPAIGLLYSPKGAEKLCQNENLHKGSLMHNCQSTHATKTSFNRDADERAAAHAQRGVPLSAKKKPKHMAKPSMNTKAASLKGCYVAYVYIKRVLVRPLRTPKHVLIKLLKTRGSENSSRQLEEKTERTDDFLLEAGQAGDGTPCTSEEHVSRLRRSHENCSTAHPQTPRLPRGWPWFSQLLALAH